MNSLTLLFSCVVFILVVYRICKIGSRAHGLPPGPATLPLLGNIHLFPTEFPHYKFTEWARQYGDIFSLTIGPGVIIVLSSVSAIKEVLDERGATTGDRPPVYMADVVTGGISIAISRYNDTWRALRRGAQAISSVQASNRYLPIQRAEASQLMYDMMKTPEDFFRHNCRFAHSMMLAVTYGVRSPRYESRSTAAYYHAQHMWEGLLAPGAHPPVDLIPALKYIPEGWPGARWKTIAKEVKALQAELYRGNLEICEQRVRSSEGETGCQLEELVRHQEEFKIPRHLIESVGATLVEGGSDATSSFLNNIVMMLVAFPEAQRKAQEEMDRVVGFDRTPTMDDWRRLPYLQAFVKEVHRFRPVTPLALPHAATTDEEYGGYLIPKGAIIFMNTWAIYHDPELFHNAENFEPERFLNSEFGTKPGVDGRNFRDTFVFGAGRRICVGMNLANNALAMVAMNTVWAFNCRPVIDPGTGQPIHVDTWAYTKGVLTGPKPFKCTVTLRSNQHADLIERQYAESVEIFLPLERHLDDADKSWIEKTRDILSL